MDNTMERDDDLSPDQKSLIAYRVGRLEKAVENVATKVDLMNETKDQVNENTIRIAYLEKSRDRLIAGLSIVATTVVAVIIMQILGVVQQNGQG